MRIERGRVVRAVFPPHEVAHVKAIACELPKTHALPLWRFSRSELHRFVVEQAISTASAATIGRWLAEDAIKPWQQRSWIFPRDPDFLAKAAPVLDLYQRRWQGKLLERGELIICADAKPSIQARARIHRSAPPAPGRGQRVEHEYRRMGAVWYLDAWDVHRGRVFGRTEPKGAIAAFDRLARQVMTKEPYASAKRVFWIVDNGSDQRGQRAKDRLEGHRRNLVLIHTPLHASWLNQAEIYHSIIQRASCSTPATSTTPPPSRTPSTTSSTTTTPSPSRSSGTSPATSSPRSWTALTTSNTTSRSPSPPDRNRTYGGQH